tara:strand:- start:226 stop:435 length:210 start_codon:yes stop_codon:yes gene_type:complete
MDVISHVTLCILFSGFVLAEFSPNRLRFIEVILLVWFTSLLAEEIRQVRVHAFACVVCAVLCAHLCISV